LPDNKAFAINAFSLNWREFFSYIFCPFSMIGPVLQKLSNDQAEAVIIAPFFATQPWFPLLLSMICQQSYLLPPVATILKACRPELKHPIPKMKLGVFRISGKNLSCQGYQETLPMLSLPLGEQVLKNNMGRISKNGMTFVIGKKLINFTHL
jgi:hypothetical protein